MIKAVIFDFGRVISAPKPMSLFRKYEEDLGIERGTLNPIMFDSPSWEQVLVGKMSLDDYWAETAPFLGLLSPEDIAAFRSRYQADERINDPVLKIVRQLRGKVKTAILSNAPQGLTEWLDDWSMLDLFDVVVCSGDEGVAKPNPAAFHLTLDRLAVTPAQAVFIDDTLGHVGAARSLGLRAIHYKSTTDLETELQDIFAAARARAL